MTARLSSSSSYFEKSPTPRKYIYWLPRQLDGQGYQIEAIAELQAAAAASPLEPNVHFDLGYLLWKQHRNEEAERELRLELAHDSSHAQAYAWLGDIALRRNDPKAAKPLLEKAVQVSGDIRIAHLDLGIV